MLRFGTPDNFSGVELLTRLTSTEIAYNVNFQVMKQITLKGLRIWDANLIFQLEKLASCC